MKYMACYINAKDVGRNPSLSPKYNVYMPIFPKAVGTTPKRFNLSFSDPLSSHSCIEWNPCYDSAPAPENCLLNEDSKTHICSNEKSIHIYDYLVAFSCVLESIVLDSYSGTCNTGIAWMQCVGGFILVDKDHICFLLAPDRLRKLNLFVFSKSRTLEPQLFQYNVRNARQCTWSRG